MTVFASSLLITCVFSMTNLLNSRAKIILGSLLFVLGCLMLVINSGSMILLSVGATLFGISVGLVPPAILVALSDNRKKRDSNLAIYNAIVALASVFSPIIGESILHGQFLPSLYLMAPLGSCHGNSCTIFKKRNF